MPKLSIEQRKRRAQKYLILRAIDRLRTATNAYDALRIEPATADERRRAPERLHSAKLALANWWPEIEALLKVGDGDADKD